VAFRTLRSRASHAQKCNRSHALEAFEGGKRACKAQLEAFNARRRARYAARKASAPSSGPGGGSDSGSQGPSSGATGSVSAAAAAAAAAARADTELLAALLGAEGEALMSPSLLLLPPEDFESAMLGAGEEIQSAASGASGAAALVFAGGEPYPGAGAWWPMLGVQLATLDVKLEGPGSAPTALPPGLRGMAASLFDSEPLAMHASIAPGCTLLSIEAMLPLDGKDNAAPGADAALRRMLAANGQLSALDSVTVTAGGRAARARRGAVQPAPEAPEAAQRPPPLSALAASCDAATTLSAALPAGTAAPALRCRVHGRFLALAVRVEKGRMLLDLPAAGEEGVAMLEPSAGAAATRGRPLLLCRDSAVVSEVNASADAARDAAEHAAALVGYALCPGATAAVAGRAAAAAMRMRWPAAAARCLAALGACEADPEAEAEAGGACFLMHEAVASSVDALRQLLAAQAVAKQPALFGAAGRADGFPGGATPLHVAARLSRGAQAAEAAEALTRCADDAGADALLAWFCARDSAGATPDALAAARRDGALAPLAATLRARLADGRAAALRAASAMQAQHGAFHWPHLAALSEAAVPEEAGETRRVACALLRQLAAAAASPQQQPLPPSAVARSATSTAEAAAEAEWRLECSAHTLEAWAAYHVIYCITLLLRAVPRPDFTSLPVFAPAPEWATRFTMPVELVASWDDGFVIMDWVAPYSFWYQAGATAALVAALLTRRGRALLAKHLQLMMVLQCVVHSLACTLHYSMLVSDAVFDARGTILVWPRRLPVCIALFTTLMAACLPLRPRYALPLVGMRGALPLLVSAFPTTFYRLWPLAPRGEALLQAGMAVGTIAVMTWRDRALTQRYVLHRAMLEARKQKQA
jgi:hypothetical protein